MAERERNSGDRGRPALTRLAALITRRPRLVLLAWLLLVGPLAIVGTGLHDKLSTKPIFIAGSDVESAHKISVREFGGEDTLVVMLRGPRSAVDQQGRELVAGLERMPGTRAISPWSSSGALEQLRPSPRVAAVIVSIGEASERPTSEAVPEVEKLIGATVHDPVRTSLAGAPAIIDGLRSSTQKAAQIGELLALPVLLIVLLLVCRSVLAALMPLLVGGLVVGATKGFVTLIAGSVAIDPIAEGAAGMFGLALGVDYSLLVVSRYREEAGGGAGIAAAVRGTVVGTGRSILPAGAGLVLAMLVSLQLLPGSFVSSLVIAVSVASVFSVLSALIATPAILVLLGENLDRWSLPRPRRSGAMAMGWSRRLSRRPALVLGLIFLLMACSAWAFTLDTNTGGIEQLPPDDPSRVQQEEIERELGPGWTAPLEVVVASGDGPVTTKRRLDAFAAFQRRVEGDPGVVAMAGFAGLQGAADELGSTERKLAAQERGIGRLDRGLDRAVDGSSALAGGFLDAAAGARRLGGAIGEARGGSGRLADGLERSATGSTRLSGGLDRGSSGSGRLADATARASDGADRLAARVSDAQEQTDEAAQSSRPLENALLSGERVLTAAPLEATEAQLSAAWAALSAMTAGRGDPQYAAAIDAVRAASRELTGAEPGSEEEEADPAGVEAGVEQGLEQIGLGLYLARQQADDTVEAGKGMEKLQEATAKLDSGLAKLRERSRDLSNGLARLSARGEELSPGLRRLTAGAESLLAGLGEIEDGSSGLAGGLDGGARGSQRLTGALGRMNAGVERPDGRLQDGSPGIFRSGYFYLAGLDGSRPERRNQAGFLVNLAGGGSAARMLVIPKDALASGGLESTGDRLAAEAEKLSRQTGTEVYVGGLSPGLVDLNKVFREQGPIARLVLSLVTVLVLLLVTRSLVLPIFAALLNLLTISALLGVMALLFDNSLLGGPGYVDTAIIPASIILTFGLAIDYEVFIFARIREEYLRTGSTAQAIDDGLGYTAHVISGAAVIMIAVFLTFSVTSLATLRNLGVSQAIGVFIDAFIVRFVILPAAMRALGDRCWWLPRWMDRILPGRSVREREMKAG